MQKDQDKPKVRKMGKTIGQSGTTIFSGHITAEEYNRRLVGISGNRIYETMRRSDATVRSTLQVTKLPLLSADWSIEPASEDEADIERAEFIEQELFNRNVDFNQFLKEALTMLDFGHSVAEKTYELTTFNGKLHIGIQDIGFRKQVTIQQWETEDGLPGIQQLIPSSTGLVNIPREKLMYFINDLEGENYEGISILRYAYKHWDMKDKLDIINVVSLEKLGSGVPVVKQPADAATTEIEAAREAMREFRVNEEAYQMIPMGWEMEMLDMKANTTKDILPSIQYHDRQIQVSVLAQFLNLGASDTGGSRALSSDQSNLFLLSEEATAKVLQNVIQKELIDQLCELNYTDMPEGCPKIKFANIGQDSIVDISEAVSKLMTAGAMTNSVETENHIRQVLKLPEISEEEYEGAKQIKEDSKTTNEDPKPAKELKEEIGEKAKRDAAVASAVRSREELISLLQD